MTDAEFKQMLGAMLGDIGSRLRSPKVIKEIEDAIKKLVRLQKKAVSLQKKKRKAHPYGR